MKKVVETDLLVIGGGAAGLCAAAEAAGAGELAAGFLRLAREKA